MSINVYFSVELPTSVAELLYDGQPTRVEHEGVLPQKGDHLVLNNLVKTSTRTLAPSGEERNYEVFGREFRWNLGRGHKHGDAEVTLFLRATDSD